jgi:fluoroacetyl-CoA thioesterase
MLQIPSDAEGHIEIVVGREHLASTSVASLPEVMSTPTMVGLMEQAATAAIAPYLEEREASVGISINIEHLAATPVGHRVRAHAQVTRIDGRRVEFRVSAFDEAEEIGRGVHRRAIIDVSKFKERLKSKIKP